MPTSSNSYATNSSGERFHHCLVHETVAALFRAALNRLWDKFMGFAAASEAVPVAARLSPGYAD